MEENDLLNSTKLPEDIKAFKDKADNILKKLQTVMKESSRNPKEFYETKISKFKKQYYQLSLQYHPDKNPEEQKIYYEEQFKIVSHIYGELIENGNRTLQGETIYDEKYLKEELEFLKALSELIKRQTKILELISIYKETLGLPEEFNPKLKRLENLLSETDLIHKSDESFEKKNAKCAEVKEILLSLETCTVAFIKKQLDDREKKALIDKKIESYSVGGIFVGMIIGGGVGAGIGFAIGGPIGAGIGAAVGAFVGVGIAMGSVVFGLRAILTKNLSSEEDVPAHTSELQNSNILLKIQWQENFEAKIEAIEKKIEKTKDNIELFKTVGSFLGPLIGIGIGAGIGFLLGGPIGAGIGIAVGICVGTAIGLPTGHLGWKPIFAKNLASLEEDLSKTRKSGKALEPTNRKKPDTSYGYEPLKTASYVNNPLNQIGNENFQQLTIIIN